MFGAQDGMRRMMDRDLVKPKNIGQTLGRFGHYFKPFWPVLLLVMLIIIVSTWAQVTVPDLLGQTVDCYLTPGAISTFTSLPGTTPESGAESNCWLEQGAERQGFTQNLVYNLVTLGGFSAPNPLDMSTQDALAGLARMTVLIVILYVLTSVLTGLSFFGMTWAGSHALREMREELFRHLHRLSLGYYAEHEAGDLMSRITNDSETIQQAFSFALINVVSGALLVVWIGYNMLKASVPFALLSLVAVPLMIAATVWLSNQARKAYRRTRRTAARMSSKVPRPSR